MRTVPDPQDDQSGRLVGVYHPGEGDVTLQSSYSLYFCSCLLEAHGNTGSAVVTVHFSHLEQKLDHYQTFHLVLDCLRYIQVPRVQWFQVKTSPNKYMFVGADINAGISAFEFDFFLYL